MHSYITFTMKRELAFGADFDKLVDALEGNFGAIRQEAVALLAKELGSGSSDGDGQEKELESESTDKCFTSNGEGIHDGNWFAVHAKIFSNLPLSFTSPPAILQFALRSECTLVRMGAPEALGCMLAPVTCNVLKRQMGLAVAAEAVNPSEASASGGKVAEDEQEKGSSNNKKAAKKKKKKKKKKRGKGVLRMQLARLSVLRGASHLWPHSGPTNTRLRLHLPLLVPQQGTYELKVGGTSKSWVEGEPVLFDDSFRHEVIAEPGQPGGVNGVQEVNLRGTTVNFSAPVRIVLILDVWHPDIPLKDHKELKRRLNLRLEALSRFML